MGNGSDNPEIRRILQRLSEMGIESKLMKGERCVIASMPLGPEPFETLTGSVRIDRVVFSCIGRDRIKCLRPRSLFQLPILRIGGCGDRADIEARIRLLWRHHVVDLEKARARLRSLCVEMEPAEEGSVLRFAIEGEQGGIQATMIDARRIVLPSTGRLSGQPFQRVNDRVVEISEGIETGVDLSIALSNRIEEISRHNEEMAEQSRRHAILEDQPPTREASGRRPHRVLLVGPRIVKERSCIDSLRLRGYEVDRAATAQEAVVAFQSRSPELIITDFELGREEGLELVPMLREVCGVEEIPVVVVDAKAHGPRREAARRIGAAGYLTYPIAIPKIASHLRGLLKDPQRRRFTRFQPRISVQIPGRRACVVTELGRGGMFLATESPIPMDELLDCQLLVPELGETLRVDCELIYRREPSGRDVGGIGARFRDFPEGDEARLIRYLTTL